MDGVVYRLDYSAVAAVIDLYISAEEKRQIFEDILMIWYIKQEVKTE